MIDLRCGCRLDVHAPTGARFNVHRCAAHIAAQNPEPDEAYYRNFGVLDADPPHVREFIDAYGEMPKGSGFALEVGCGVSSYAKMIEDAGYTYIGLDASKWAAEFMTKMVGYQVDCGNVEEGEIGIDDSRILILAAHVLEHVHDAPKVLAKFFDALTIGGYLYIIVPDDTDLTNPDHCWFFSKESLETMVRDAGFIVETVQVRKRVPHENFLYLRARRWNPARFPMAYPGLAGKSWMYADEMDRLIELIQIRDRVLEIGSADGVTAAKIARERPESIVVSVDPYTQYPESNGFPPSEKRLSYWMQNKASNQSLWIGNVGGMHEFCKEKFDAVIVDAEHSFTETYDNLMYAAQMVADAGIIFAHDYDPAAFPQVAKSVDRFCESHGWRVDEVKMTLAILRK